MGRPYFWTTLYTKPMDRRTLKLAGVTRLGTYIDLPNLVEIGSLGETPQWCDITHLSLLSLPFPSLLYPCASAQPKRIDRFSRLMAQMTCSVIRKCLLGVTTDNKRSATAYKPQNAQKNSMSRTSRIGNFGMENCSCMSK